MLLETGKAGDVPARQDIIQKGAYHLNSGQRRLLQDHSSNGSGHHSNDVDHQLHTYSPCQEISEP